MQLKADLEDISQVKKRLRVEIPVEIATSEFQKVAQDFRRHARLPGFRRGKAPLNLIKSRFSSDIRGEVIQNLVPEWYDRAVTERSLRPISRPSLDKLECEDGKPLVFEAEFEVAPVFEVENYLGLKIRLDPNEIRPEDVDRELEQLRERNKQQVAVEDRPVESGDIATIDFTGVFVESESAKAPRQPIQEEGVLVRVGDERTLEAFSENLPGMNIGEERTFEVTYPEDYPEKKLGGQTVRFVVEVTDIKREVLPELNDQFARDLEYDSLDALKKGIEANLKQLTEINRKNQLREKAIDQLIERTEFELPNSLVEARMDRKLEEAAYRLAHQGFDPRQANVDWRRVREDFREDAEREARGQLILDAVTRKENIEVGREELDEEMAGIAQQLDQPLEKVRQYYQQEDQVISLTAQLARRKALRMVEEAVVIEN